MFDEIDADFAEFVLDEKGEKEIVELKGKGRVRWTLKRTRITWRRSELDRLKINLNLMISVIKHARDLYEKEFLDRCESAKSSFVSRPQHLHTYPAIKDKALGLRIETSRSKRWNWRRKPPTPGIIT